MILGGYTLGRSVPNIGQRIHYVIAVVIVLSLLPAIISILRARRQSKSQGSAASVGVQDLDVK
jgi:membrane-associated protein